MTATEDRMRQAFDNPDRSIVQLAAAVADLMVDEATAALRKQHAEMLAALKALLRCPDLRDIDPEDRDPETDEAERMARKAIAAAEASGTGDRS